MFEGTPAEEMDAQELRAKGSQKARAHQVVQDRCPACGSWLAASLVAEIKRGEARCPAGRRASIAFSKAMAQLFGDAT